MMAGITMVHGGQGGDSVMAGVTAVCDGGGWGGEGGGDSHCVLCCCHCCHLWLQQWPLWGELYRQCLSWRSLL